MLRHPLIAQTCLPIFSAAPLMCQNIDIYARRQKNLVRPGRSDDLSSKRMPWERLRGRYRQCLITGLISRVNQCSTRLPYLRYLLLKQTLQWLKCLVKSGPFRRKSIEKAQWLYDEIERNKLFGPEISIG